MKPPLPPLPRDFGAELAGLHASGWRQAAAHGDAPRWTAAIAELPERAHAVRLDADCIRIGAANEIDLEARMRTARALMALHPWRKGPFSVFGIEIDAEWRSDMKWRRLAPHLPPLEGLRALDVGCGSGYHCWRMRGSGAATVLGLDPTPLYAFQFAACQRLIADASVGFIPVGIEAMPASEPFDIVFSMGVLYHRRNPIEHLLKLRRLLVPRGTLVLESLIVDGGANTCLVPPGRYAKMRNVWFIPSVPMLETWLARAGFRSIRCVDVTPTTISEQRATRWMRFESLRDFLDPHDPTRTIEGHPAPVRAIFLAEAP
ncbi:MAG: tRNA 5-methoxyuridine(34)/uridine 5-oxyacetic acid(34) synthase CmoB [Mariprofundaceae bacterium]